MERLRVITGASRRMRGRVSSPRSWCLLMVFLALALPALASAGFQATGSMSGARQGHAAVLLQNGKVLVAGGFGPIGGGYFAFLSSAELYDPASGSFSPTGSMSDGRQDFGAALLQSGKVLVAGGYGGIGFSVIGSAELYDPASGSFTSTGSEVFGRAGATTTLLPNGKVLIAGGYTGPYIFAPTATAELYDPSSGSFSLTGPMSETRVGATATLLGNGKVLIAGGNNGFTATAELYDAATGTFSPTGSMLENATGRTATLLKTGKVLIAGGFFYPGPTDAELYDPASGAFSATGALATARVSHTATLLPNGQVLYAGGNGAGSILQGAETYDPATGVFSDSGSMTTQRQGQTATLLPDGSVLLAGGCSSGCGFDTLSSAELYTSVTPASLLDELLAAVAGVGPGASLTDKVTLAIASLNANDTAGTCSTLNAFGKQVNAQTGKTILPAQAASLLTDAAEVETLLGC